MAIKGNPIIVSQKLHTILGIERAKLRGRKSFEKVILNLLKIKSQHEELLERLKRDGK